MAGSPCRGVVLIVVVVGLAVAVSIFLAILKLVVVQRQTLDSQWREAQAACLADSAIQRAVARLAADPAYPGETWNLSAEAMAGPEPGVAVIRVEAVAGHADRRTVSVDADYPDHPTLRARRHQQAIVLVSKAVKP